MGESRSVRVGVIVLAITVVAGVAALLWMTRPNDTAGGAKTGASVENERNRAPRPALENGAGETTEEAPTPAAATGSLHDRLGGRAAIHAISGKLLEAVPTNAVIMANEKVRTAAQRLNVRELHQRFTDFVCKEAGGPCTYTGRPMKDYLAQLELTSAEWDALHDVLAAVFAEMKVPEREAEELTALFDALEASVTAH